MSKNLHFFAILSACFRVFRPGMAKVDKCYFIEELLGGLAASSIVTVTPDSIVDGKATWPFEEDNKNGRAVCKDCDYEVTAHRRAPRPGKCLHVVCLLGWDVCDSSLLRLIV